MIKKKKETIKSLKEQLLVARELNEQIRNSEIALRKSLDEARKFNQFKIDQSLINERQKMMSSLGQLVEAISKAIVYVVGKEAL